MRLIHRLARRWRMILVVVVVSAGGLGSGFARWLRDPWPARLILAARPDDWSNGFSADGRSYSVVRSAPPGQSQDETWYDISTGRVQTGVAAHRPDFRTMSHDRQSSVERLGEFWSWEKVEGNELVWRDAASGEIRRRFPVAAGFRVYHLAFGGDDRSIRAFVSNENPILNSTVVQQVVTWNLDTGARTERPITHPPGWQTFFAADGSRCAYLDSKLGGLQIWNLDTDQALGGLIPIDGTALTMAGIGHLPVAELAPDGRTLVIGQPDGLVEFWDLIAARRVKTARAHDPGEWHAMTHFAPDGRTLASAGSQWTASALPSWCWDLAQRLAPGWLQGRTEVAVLDVASGQIRGRIQGGYQPQFSPDGQTLITRRPDGSFAVRAVREAPAR